jgi:hypothetical protein
MLGLNSTILYYISSGAYLFATYSLWSDGAWYYANSTRVWRPTLTTFFLSLLCWLVVVWIFVSYMRRFSNDRASVSSNLKTTTV